MTQREIDRIRKMERWRAIIAEVDKKEEHISIVCARHGVTAAQYYYWRKQLVKDVLDNAAALAIHTAPAPVEVAPVIAAAETVACENAAEGAAVAEVKNKYNIFSDHEHDKAVEFVATKDRVSVRELSNGIGVSEARARAILRALGDEGVVSNGGQHSGLARKVLRHIVPASIAPAPVAEVVEQKNIDTQVELSVDGVVFDMEHNRLYVPGTATEKTIRVAISILKGLIPQTVEPAAVLA